MNRNYLIALIVSLSLLSCKPNEERNPNPVIAQLDSLIDSEHGSNRFDGTIVIGNNDSIIFSKAIGSANRVWDVPLQLTHRFDICSINKSFIATLVLIAVEEGKLNLNDLLIDKINSHAYEGKFDDKITIHHMLSHTSGLPDYEGVSEDLSANQYRSMKRLHVSNDEYVNFISRIAPINQPGKEFYYSNFAYALLAILLEDLYQQPFSNLLQEKICEPLGLEQTFNATSNEEVFPQMSEAYNYDKIHDTWNRNNFIDLTLGRRIFSSTLDLYKWGKAMNDEAILNAQSLALMQTNHLPDITQDISYGYGWVIFDGAANYKIGDVQIDKKYIIHGGNTEGYKSMLVNIEKGEFIIAILANTGEQTNEMELTQKIVQILINQK